MGRSTDYELLPPRYGASESFMPATLDAVPPSDPEIPPYYKGVYVEALGKTIRPLRVGNYGQLLSQVYAPEMHRQRAYATDPRYRNLTQVHAVLTRRRVVPDLFSYGVSSRSTVDFSELVYSPELRYDADKAARRRAVVVSWAQRRQVMAEHLTEVIAQHPDLYAVAEDMMSAKMPGERKLFAAQLTGIAHISLKGVMFYEPVVQSRLGEIGLLPLDFYMLGGAFAPALPAVK